MAKAGVQPSPFAPARLPEVPVVPGVVLASCEAGIRYKGRRDVMMAVLDPGTVIAGVLTRSKTSSAPVLWCRENLKAGKARALVVNSGNANAFTGKKGVEATRLTAAAAAQAVGCSPGEVFLSSTGVIGEPLDASKFTHLIAGLVKSATPDAWHDAARAIMTTDTFPKLATRTVKLGGAEVVINGFAKGAGMIAPDLATMLVYIFTDAAVAQPALQAMLSTGADTSFNCITIDSDTSTSDTVLAFATGAARRRGAPLIEDVGSAEGRAFAAALHDLMHELALWVVKDGEGLTRLIEVRVSGAETDAAARRIAFAIANSPLVKTAVAGGDPNWGRVVMAVGKAGEVADRDRLSIRFGDILVAENGERAASYDEKTVAAYMQGREIVIGADLGLGAGAAVVWTCDLTHGYISINADYRS
ncbi:MAG TPA: bifunctional glutamate N-acetyltransferase/amino-acid acetyltransferase ArgJ [Hyphomicrobiaceae bacterium]|nr:bifunctional glutamate N-acetyltransferase/amino-acid acetyltransferase ArgJ [Hyphomicrobiaceae bacterium]